MDKLIGKEMMKQFYFYFFLAFYFKAGYFCCKKINIKTFRMSCQNQ
jgi:hypothetical protein